LIPWWFWLLPEVEDSGARNMRKPGTRNTIVPRDAVVTNEIVAGRPDLQTSFHLIHVP
jgi:hypothetical protein